MRPTHTLLGAACVLALTFAALIPLKERKPEDGKIKLVTPSHVDVENHGEVRMECIFYNLVYDDIIVWKKGNDEPIFMDHDSAIDDTRFAIDNEETEDADGGRKSVMTLERIDSSDDNTYYCGSVETNTFIPIRMRVKIHPTARMTPDHWPYIVLNLQPVSLKCSVTGNPLPKIHWFKEGGQIPPHISVQGDTLHIMNAEKSDAGIYVCHANNTAGTAIAKTDLRVHDPHDITGAVSPPWARMAVAYAPVAMNGRINISCSYDGNPSPTVEWLFNGAKLTHGRPTNVGMNNLKQYGIRHDNHSESILEIISASPDYFGDYSCKVTNEHGTAKDVTYLSAMPSPPDLSLDGTILTVTAQAPPTGIEELALFFRKPNESGWINKKSIAVAKGDQTGEKTWSKQINLSDFLESGQFEIQVQARNNYGYGNKANDMIRVTVPEKSDVPTASAPMAASSSIIAALLLLIGN